MTAEALQQRTARPTRRARRRAAATPRPRLRPLAVFVIAVLIAFFGMIFSRVSLDRTAFELQELDVRITQELERTDQLRVEAARLLSPDRIRERAADLGMVYPESRTQVVIDRPLTVAPAGAEVDLRTLLSTRP